MTAIEIIKLADTDFSFTFEISEVSCFVKDENNHFMKFNFFQNGETLTVEVMENDHFPNSFKVLYQVLDILFFKCKNAMKAEILLTTHVDILKDVLLTKQDQVKFLVTKQDFYQTQNVWGTLSEDTAVNTHLKNTNLKQVTHDRLHPVRPLVGKGLKYKRFYPEIGKMVSYRSVDVEADLDLFHEWHNKPRVYDLWELNKSKEELKDYLIKAQKDLHQVPLIMEFDGVPVGYYEIYWAAEDRIAPYYDYDIYDRGFHFLIGDETYLGLDNTSVALRSAMHMIFLDEPRTQHIVGEPRSDNKRVLKYLQLIPGWKFVKEFDFPHKRAALLMADRDVFFKDGQGFNL